MLGTGYQQEVHLEHLFQDVAEYNQMITTGAVAGAGRYRGPDRVLPPWRRPPDRCRTTSRSPTPATTRGRGRSGEPAEHGTDLCGSPRSGPVIRELDAAASC